MVKIKTKYLKTVQAVNVNYYVPPEVIYFLSSKLAIEYIGRCELGHRELKEVTKFGAFMLPI